MVKLMMAQIQRSREL